jgi:hypothetical protein
VEFNPLINRIVCVAIKYEDGTIISGVRHFCPAMRQLMLKINPDYKYWNKMKHEQGFLDKFSEFKTREEAYIIAKFANQIVRDHHIEGELFSEHLY